MNVDILMKSCENAAYRLLEQFEALEDPSIIPEEAIEERIEKLIAKQEDQIAAEAIVREHIREVFTNPSRYNPHKKAPERTAKISVPVEDSDD